MLCDECGEPTSVLTGAGVCPDCLRRSRSPLQHLSHLWVHDAIAFREFTRLMLFDYASKLAYMPNVMLSSVLVKRIPREEAAVRIKDNTTGAVLADIPARYARPMLVLAGVVMGLRALFWVGLIVAAVAFIAGSGSVAAVFACVAAGAKVVEFALRPVGRRIGNTLKSRITVAVASQ